MEGQAEPIARRTFQNTTVFNLFLCAAASLAIFALSACNSNNSKSTASEAAQAASPATSTPAKAPAALSPSELKEVQARDTYASNLAKMLHARMPAYKNVKIYADSWAGPKAPARTPLADIKARTGDNLMLVFWSPDADSARGLADFTKSQAARDAVNAGFAEFQFVDPGSYCYSQVTPVGGISQAICGIR